MLHSAAPLRIATLLCAFALLLAAPASAASRPDPNWRLPVRQSQLQASSGAIQPGPSDGPPQFEWQTRLSTDAPAATLQVPAPRSQRDALLVFAYVDVQPARAVRLTLETTAGQVVQTEEITAKEDLVGRQRSLIARDHHGKPLTLRVALAEPSSEAATVRLTRLQFFRLRPGMRPDGWMVVAASINIAAFRDTDRFWRMTRERYPNADPLMIHCAIGGWVIEHGIARAPEMLARHPQIRTVVVHIGGNNVSRNRPYPRGVTEIRNRMRELLQRLSGDEREVYLSRLSFRAYKREPVVGPEHLGSLPYNVRVYDPLIREFSPTLIDPVTGSPRMDPYTYFRDHPEELSEDGVHNNARGSESWVRLWLDAVGPLVYGPASPTKR
jgi:hypothetical protein